MEKDDLKNIEKLRKEITAIEVSIDRMQPTDLTDYYKDYSHNYKGVVKSLHGIGYDPDELKKRELKLKRRHRQLQRIVSEAEEYIDSIKDPELRAILRMYYVEGLTQSEIGQILNLERSTVAKKLKYFFTYG